MSGIYDLARINTLQEASEATAYWEGGPVTDRRRTGPKIDWPYTTANGGWFYGRNWPDWSRTNNSSVFGSSFFQAPFAWGHIYQAATPQNVNLNSTTNTMVNIRNGKTLLLRLDGSWEVWAEQTVVDGAFYAWDFINDAQYPGERRFETDGTISIRPQGRYTFHFWHGPKSNITNPASMRGILTSVEARLVVRNPALADDRANARYVAQSGCDLYHSSPNYNTVSAFDPIGAVPAIGSGGHGIVTNDWRVFTFTTLTAAEILANPPPGWEADSGGGGGGGGVTPQPPQPIISRPSTGTWEAKTSGGSNNWFAGEATRTAPTAVRRRRPSRFW